MNRHAERKERAWAALKGALEPIAAVGGALALTLGLALLFSGCASIRRTAEDAGKEVAREVVKTGLDELLKGVFVVTEHRALKPVRFAFDNDKLRPDAAGPLGAVAAWLHEEGDRSVRVIGHACAHGPEDYNAKLGYRRAARAAAALHLTAGIPAARIVVESRGEAVPTGLGHAADRRVAFVGLERELRILEGSNRGPAHLTIKTEGYVGIMGDPAKVAMHSIEIAEDVR